MDCHSNMAHHKEKDAGQDRKPFRASPYAHLWPIVRPVNNLTMITIIMVWLRDGGAWVTEVEE